MTGVDLSNYQSGLDLSKLRSGGYSFAILKLSEGRGLADASFDRFYDAAVANGIPVGAYVYSHAISATAAKAEAEFALSLLKGRVLPLGIFMDIETTGQMQIAKSQLKDTVNAFRYAVNHAGYAFGIYGSEYNAWSRLDPSDFANDTIWVAHYGKAPAMACDLWQRTDAGNFPGYYGNVDVDEVVSDRFRDLVEQPTPKPEKPDFPINPTVLAFQLWMNYNGYACETDGKKTPEFFKILREFVNDMEGC